MAFLKALFLLLICFIILAGCGGKYEYEYGYGGGDGSPDPGGGGGLGEDNNAGSDRGSSANREGYRSADIPNSAKVSMSASKIVEIIGVSSTQSTAPCKEKTRNVTVSRDKYVKITASEVKSMIDNGDPLVLVDVRTEDEYAQRHIEGALLIPHGEIEERAGDELPDKDALVIVYCRSGGRSESAARKLIDLGYANVLDMGGILEWAYDAAGS